MSEFSSEAEYVLRALAEKPYNDTPGAIYADCEIEQIDQEGVVDGLREVQAAGLAVEENGRWRLTQAGIDWFPA